MVTCLTRYVTIFWLTPYPKLCRPYRAKTSHIPNNVDYID